MKKTLIITLEYPPQVGGIATYVHDLADALDPKQTIVLAPWHAESAAWDSQRKYRVVRRKLLFPFFIWPRWIKLCWIVSRLVKKEGIELIMIHHVLPVGYAGVLMRMLKKVPFLIFSHGTDLIAGTHTAWKRAMVARVAQRAEQIIFNSESLKRRFLRVLPQFEKSSMVLYPCPEATFLTPPKEEELTQLREQYALEGKQVMLSVSRLDEGKGFPHLIRIMPDILQYAPNLVWVIVGDGPKWRATLEMIYKNELQNVIRYVGMVPHEMLKPYYYLADLFVLLTHPDDGKEEGLGLVFLEAAAAGLPVVAGKSGGVEEAVIHGQTGLVFDVHQQLPDITKALIELLGNKEHAKQLGKAAQDRIQKDFQWQRQIELLKPWIG